MLAFIARRLVVSVLVFLAATVVVFLMAVNVGDPLAEARQLPSGPAQESAIAEITERMNLDEPVYIRYFLWLGGVLTGDLGVTATGHSVNAMLENAVGATLQLVLGATVLSIVIGISIGVISALRQYSGLDLSVTFAAFLFYSLPVFWVGTLLKQFVAIDLNNWLADPTLALWVIGLVALFVALFCASLVVGDRRTRLTTFAVGFLGMVALLWALSETGWFADPGLGVFVIAVTAIAGAVGFTTLFSGLDWNSPVMRAAMTAAVAGIVCALVLDPVLADPNLATIGLLALITAAVCFAFGWVIGGELYRRSAIQAAMWTGLFTGALIFVDRMLQSFASYSEMKGGRPVSTIGAGTPNFEGTFWQSGLDSVGHLALPTLALMLISLATYTRYTRASMLEVMNQDYVRTARAKGLPERAVVTRHSLRNGLIPITTLTAYDIGTVMGGAVVTETVFGWRAMGRMLLDGIQNGDPGPIMAFFLVAGGAIVVFNMIADITYGFLDPRIRQA
ncbi:ABC transporter permease [Haloechinothrix sp. LS1_15]|uniref:ABC transporter permease n=1 Tax=Haloechinothrix sp. LS1_15 TaxID=2652248 RepID=UPI0029487FD5|nr:ABC transporter permease [Haloechinothrix sp. LS1_15]MDV6011551.1 ABC transporter permease [Haloechinothrix sp. LS1_15]